MYLKLGYLSSDKTQATIVHLLKSSILFVKNLTAVVDQFEHHFVFILSNIYDFGKIGWRQAQAGWSKLESALKIGLLLGSSSVTPRKPALLSYLILILMPRAWINL